MNEIFSGGIKLTSGYYDLYLDECVYSYGTENVYAIIGIAIERSTLTDVRKKLGELKIDLWETMPTSDAKNIVLHAAEIYHANSKKKFSNPNYQIFAQNVKVRDVFNGIKDIIVDSELTIIGSVVNINSLKNKYKMRVNHYHADSICLKSILNNYACFLKCHNAKGSIVFESRSSSSSDFGDAILKKLYYKTMTHGTNLYTPFDLQSVIDNIDFVKKQENEAGLQIVDCIAQSFIYNSISKKQKKPNIYKDIRKRRYSGGKTVGETDSNIFGVTYIK